MIRAFWSAAVALTLILALAGARPATALPPGAQAPHCIGVQSSRPIVKRGNRAAESKARRVLLKRINSWARRRRVTPRIDQAYSRCAPDARGWSCIAGARVCVNTNHPGPEDLLRFRDRPVP